MRAVNDSGAARPADDRLLDVRAVAARLGICARGVWKLRAAGRLPGAVKLGRATRWRASDIDRFIGAGCTVETAGER